MNLPSNTLQTTIADVSLEAPDVAHDAAQALLWFTSPYGKETLQRMGNTNDVATITPTLKQQQKIWQDFVNLEKSGVQTTWAIRYKQQTIGVIWIEHAATDTLSAPSIHILIGDKTHRGKGFGVAAMQAVIMYVQATLHVPALYSRHLANNFAIAHINKKLGFMNDGKPYQDSDDLVWQNVVLKT